MSFSVLPLSYCTNAHPGSTVEEVLSGLAQFTQPLQKQCGVPVAAGLWLAQPVIAELLATPQALTNFAQEINQLELTCYTLNAFPYGNFHQERVKENVYLPDWTTNERLQYTIDCATVLATLLPTGTEGSISTVPLGFKPLAGSSLKNSDLNLTNATNGNATGVRSSFDFENNADFTQQCIQNLITLSKELDNLHDATGSVIRLAIEPEPLCVLETTDETIAFFKLLFHAAQDAGLEEIVERHIGVCYDVCHQSVEFEDVAASIQSLNDAGIRLNKIHITCAIEINTPADNLAARELLAQYVEPRYLHQAFAMAKQQSDIYYQVDLSKSLALTPSAPFHNADTWRIHFHVPVHAESIGSMKTTRHDLICALEAVLQLGYAPHLEVETYTWNVMPGEKPVSLVDSLALEVTATHALLETIAKR